MAHPVIRSDEQLDWGRREQPHAAQRQVRQRREPPGDGNRDGKYRQSAGNIGLRKVQRARSPYGMAVGLDANMSDAKL